MNDTKWIEIFKAFYYDFECSDDPERKALRIDWTTRSLNGYVYSDSTWTHFCGDGEPLKELDWLKIDLTPENRDMVLEVLRNIHVPGEIFPDCVYVYGHRMDVDYL